MVLFIKRVIKRNYLIIMLFLLVFGSIGFLDNVQNNVSAQNDDILQNGIITRDYYDDLELIDFATFLGGTGDETGISSFLHYLGGTAVDSQGNIIVVGRSASTNFPTKNAYQSSVAGSIDVTISKFRPNGSLIFSTYLGGSADDWANCVTLDSNDNIIIGGCTGSTNFPLKNPYQDTLLGGSESDADCFIAKLSKDGQKLLYSTYFGGTGSDWCYAICVNSNDKIAFTGTTYSASIPLVNPYQANSEGSLEIYVTLFSADGQSIVFSTYLGSGGWDTGRGIAFDSAGDLLVTGQIANAAIGTEGAFQQTFRGGTSDAFLAKFKTDGTLKYFTFIGGNSFDRANDLQVDSEDNIIITGYTNSGNFPTENPFQDFYVNYNDVFVTKINKTGTNVIFSTYMGGTSQDVGFAVAIDMDDNILITGETSSPAFPVYYDLGSPTGASDCLLAKFAKNGSLLFSTIFGGSSLDLGVGVAVYNHNSTVIVGFTLSNNLPVCNAYQDTYGGNCDLFVMKIQTMDLTIVPIVEEIPTPTPTPSPTETSGLSLLSFVFVALPALLFMFRKNSKKSLN